MGDKTKLTIKEGYKLTEVGVIPEDWEVKTCKEICLKIQDGTHFSPKLGGFDYLYVTSKNIGFGFLDISDVEKIDATQHKNIYARCDVKHGDLLLTKDGANTGNAAINYLTEEFSLLSSVAFLRFNLKKHEPQFYLQYILSKSGQIRIKELMSGNAITRLTLEKIKKFSVPVPPLPEQRAIAEALSDMDSLITSLEELITKKRNIKQGAMQELLTCKKRLAGFNDKWETKKLGEVSQIKTGPFGSSLHEKDYVEDGTPIITVEHLGERGIIYDNLPMVSEFDRRRLRAYSLQVGDIVFSRVGSVDRNALIRKKENGWLFSGRLLRIRPKEKNVYSAFLSYLFHYEPTKQQIRNVAVGQTMPSLNTAIMKTIDINANQ